MHPSTLLVLAAVFGPLAVLSSPHPPPVWEIEIVTISLDDARLFRPPGRPATATTSSSGPIITSGTEKDQNPDDECENEASSSSAAGANPLAGGAGNNSLPTTLSSVVVADKVRRQETTPPSPADVEAKISLVADFLPLGDKVRRQVIETTPPAKLRRQNTIGSPPPNTIGDKLRRQADDDSSSTTTSAVAAGVNPPAGFAGTNYPSPTTTSMSPGGGAGLKKLKGNGCAKGPVKLKDGSGGAALNATVTTTSAAMMKRWEEKLPV